MARTERAAAAVCFPEESMLLITDSHMNTWKLDFTNDVANILCSQYLFFSYSDLFCVDTF